MCFFFLSVSLCILPFLGTFYEMEWWQIPANFNNSFALTFHSPADLKGNLWANAYFWPQGLLSATFSHRTAIPECDIVCEWGQTSKYRPEFLSTVRTRPNLTSAERSVHELGTLGKSMSLDQKQHPYRVSFSFAQWQAFVCVWMTSTSDRFSCNNARTSDHRQKKSWKIICPSCPHGKEGTGRIETFPRSWRGAAACKIIPQ